MEYILEAKGLKKSFGPSQVLKGVDLKIRPGEFLAVMGQSGSGKSTLLYNISGMDRPTEGRVIFQDQDLFQLSDEKLSKIRLEQMGFIFQKSHLLKNLSLGDNIILPGFKSGKYSRDQVNRYGKDLMVKMGIDHVAGHDISQVSGGQLQRAAICRALINRPQMIFGDEPTGALNSSASREVMDILNQINEEGTSLMVVTHDPKVAARASRLIFLADGQIIAQVDLGKYRADQRGQREEKMLAWLACQAF